MVSHATGASWRWVSVARLVKAVALLFNSYILSEGLTPIPHKLAPRILRGKFTDMAVLLRDNLEAHRQSSLANQQVSFGAKSQ